MTSEPEVYIIESLRIEDEDAQRFEGDVIAKTLNLSGKKPAYRYIRTRQELQEFADEFEDSEYRYLHLSMHADANGVALTFDHLGYDDLVDMFGSALKNKRLFVSGCQMSNVTLARLAIGKHGAYSILGPERKIGFDDAAVFWLAFYHLAFKIDSGKMKKNSITHAAENMSMLLEEPINYFTRSNNQNGYKKVVIHHTDPT